MKQPQRILIYLFDHRGNLVFDPYLNQAAIIKYGEPSSLAKFRSDWYAEDTDYAVLKLDKKIGIVVLMCFFYTLLVFNGFLITFKKLIFMIIRKKKMLSYSPTTIRMPIFRILPILLATVWDLLSRRKKQMPILFYLPVYTSWRKRQIFSPTGRRNWRSAAASGCRSCCPTWPPAARWRTWRRSTRWKRPGPTWGK